MEKRLIPTVKAGAQPGDDIAAIYVNYFQVNVAGGVARVAFGEQVGGGPVRYRAAHAMTIDSAIALRDLLIRFLPLSAPPSDTRKGPARFFAPSPNKQAVSADG